MQIQFFFPLNKFLSKSFLFFVFFFTFITNAQEPFIRKISFLEGLPSDVIYDMYVSKNGLLYLGTDKGLVSYDGIHFTLFPFDENLSNSVNSIQEDEKGIIYCKNFSNQIYYLSDDRLNLDTNFDDLITKKKLSVVEFSVLGKQKVLLTPNQFFGIEKNKSFLIYQSEGLLDKNDFFHLAFNPFKNEFYISSIATILSFKNKKLQHKIKVKNGGNILEFHQGQLCYSAKSIESKVSVGESFIDISNLKQTVINKISSCENDLWICSNDGVFEINLDLKKAENDFLKGKRISDIVKDKEGNHWISTLDNGLFFMPNKNLKNLSIKQIDEQKKPNFSRVKIAKNGHFFVATSTGCVYEFNEKGVQILRYQSENNLEIEFITLHNDLILTSAAIFKVGNPKPISHKSMYFGKDIVVDNYGNFIIASSTYAGLLASDLNTKLVIPKNFGKFQLRKFGTNASFLCFRERRSRAVFYDKSSLELFLKENRIPILTVVVKKDKVINVGSFSEKLDIQNVEDYHLWLKLLLSNGVFYSSDHILAKYRVHGNSATSNDKVALDKIPTAFYDLLQIYPSYKKQIEQELKLKFKSIYKRNLFKKHELAIWIKKNTQYLSKAKMSYLYLFLNFLLPTKVTKRALIYILNA